MPRTLDRSEHPISRRDIDPNVLKVLYRLTILNHIYYMVGGSVRYLMLGRRPKDFDIATAAHPHQVRELFRNSRLIGRRFRLVHVFFGPQNIEVATFRRRSEENVEDGDLLIRHDNTFGTPEEDAFRRDFTVNALFYDIQSFRVIDYVGGVDDLLDAADGVIRLAVAQMAGALRQVSVQRGIDPREYTLIAFGGAGPLHAGLLLRELGFRAVLIPRYPGLFAATGLLATDLRIDESRTVLRVLGPGLAADLASWYAETAQDLTARLRADGIPRTRVRLAASADCRFVGQGYELSIPVIPRGRAGVASLAARFRDAHLRTYGHADLAQDVEVVTLRLSAFGALPVPAPAAAPDGAGRDARPAGGPGVAARIGEAQVRLPGSPGPQGLPVYDRARLAPGETVTGPAIVHQVDTTTVILAGQQARTDPHGTMWLEEAR